MLQIVIGIAVILLDITLTVGQVSVDVLPDFVGFLFLAVGLRKMSAYSKHFIQCRSYAFLMLVYNALTFAVELTGWANTLGLLFVICGVIALLYFLYILYKIIRGIAEIESRFEKDLQSDLLKLFWFIVAGFNCLMYFCLIFLYGLFPLCSLAALAANVVFIVLFAKLYAEFRKLSPETVLELPGSTLSEQQSCEDMGDE